MALNLVEPVSSSGAQVTYTDKPNGSLNKEDFLNLLVTQLKNQDPLNPLEGTDFTAQLAQFSSLEQLFDINENLSRMAAQRASLANIEALSLVGAKVMAPGDSLVLGEEGGALGRYSTKEAANVKLTILDSTGKIVRTIQPGLVAAGEYDLNWDGLDDSGERCPAGDYRFVAEATNLSGKKVAVNTFHLSVVTGVKFKGNEPYLVIGGAGGTEVALSNLTEIMY